MRSLLLLLLAMAKAQQVQLCFGAGGGIVSAPLQKGAFRAFLYSSAPGGEWTPLGSAAAASLPTAATPFFFPTVSAQQAGPLMVLVVPLGAAGSSTSLAPEQPASHTPAPLPQALLQAAVLQATASQAAAGCSALAAMGGTLEASSSVLIRLNLGLQAIDAAQPQPPLPSAPGVPGTPMREASHGLQCSPAAGLLMALLPVAAALSFL